MIPAIAEMVQEIAEDQPVRTRAPERITRADDGAVGNRIWQHARAEALALAEVGRQVKVGHGLP